MTAACRARVADEKAWLEEVSEKRPGCGLGDLASQRRREWLPYAWDGDNFTPKRVVSQIPAIRTVWRI